MLRAVSQATIGLQEVESDQLQARIHHLIMGFVLCAFMLQ